MYQATMAIYSALKEDEKLLPFMEESEHTSSVWLQFGAKNGCNYRIHFISTDDDNDVAVRVYRLVQVEEDLRSKVLPLLNDINARYRYVKFTCCEDGDVNIDYDFPVDGSDPAASAKEIIIHFVRIINDVYPEIMRAMWC